MAYSFPKLYKDTSWGSLDKFYNGNAFSTFADDTVFGVHLISFIVETLRKLEPRIEIKGSVIFEELDEINEVIFI